MNKKDVNKVPDYDQDENNLSESAHSNTVKKSKRRKKKSWFDRLLNILIVSLILAGLFFLIRPNLVRMRRAELAKELQNAVDRNIEIQIAYDPSANRIQDAEYDYFEVNEVGRVVGASAPSGEATTLSQGLQYMTPIGRLEIPLLNVNIPLIKELDYYAMYYAASHWDKTPYPDQPGNSAIFIHRDSYDDYNFTHAEKLKEGDPIYLTYKGERHRYTIINFNTIWPSETINELLTTYQSDSIQYITLVTCTPPSGSGQVPFTHRLLITAVLNDEKPVSPADSRPPDARDR